MKTAHLRAFLLAVAVALALAACTPPPMGTVTGYVVNRKAGTPVAGTTVRAQGSAAKATTDAQGHYSIAVPAGEAALVFSQAGYATSQVVGLQVTQDETTHYDTIQQQLFDPALPTEAPSVAVSLEEGSTVDVGEDNLFSFTVTASVAEPDVNGFAFATAALSTSRGSSGTLNASVPGTPVALGTDGEAEVALSAAGFDGVTTLHVVVYDQNDNRTELIRRVTVHSTITPAAPQAPTDLGGLAVTFGDTGVFGPLGVGQGYTGSELLDAALSGDLEVLAKQAALMREAGSGLRPQSFLDEAVTWVDLTFDYPVPAEVRTRAEFEAKLSDLPGAFEVVRSLGGADEVSIGRIDPLSAALFVDVAGTEDPGDDLLAGFQYRDATPGLQAGLEATYRVDAVTGDARESSETFSVTPQPPFYVTADSPADDATGVPLVPTYTMSFENRSDLVIYGVLLLDRVQAENNAVDWLYLDIDDSGETTIDVPHNADGEATTPTLQPFHAYDWAPAALTANGSFDPGTGQISGTTAISIAADFYLLGSPLGSIFGVDFGAQDGPVNTFLTGDGSQ